MDYFRSALHNVSDYCSGAAFTLIYQQRSTMMEPKSSCRLQNRASTAFNHGFTHDLLTLKVISIVFKALDYVGGERSHNRTRLRKILPPFDEECM